MKKIEIYDTTLRDGAQQQGIAFSLADKLQIVQKLDELGFHFIEAGWPGSNPKDTEFFKKAEKLKLKKAQLVAFGMTCRKGFQSHQDPNLKDLLAANTLFVTLFGKSWDLQVEKVLKMSLKENLALIKESCAFLKKHQKRVFYDAEHFFDGFKSNPDYALKTLKAACQGGAERIILCDTNGGSLPWEISQIIQKVKKEIKVPLGIHTHNDGDLAVANTLVAVLEGVIQVQGTINGYGERCGNANLCSVIPNLQLKMGFSCLAKKSLSQLTETSYYIAELANLSPNPSEPFVGANAFTHKAGVHADAVAKLKESYQHIDPLLVGNFSHIVVSELSGKANIMAKLKEFGLNLPKDHALTQHLLKKIKELEHQGFQFEGADASLELLARKLIESYQSPFQPLDFKIVVKKKKDKEIVSQAVVYLKIGDKILKTSGEGNGPVNALDNALRQALLPVFPQLKGIHLTDYKVRIINSKKGTAAQVRVLIETSDKRGHTWNTVGSSTNIIEASWQALLDSFEYALLKNSLSK